ncbi:hypothetical protein ETB97_003167 [Aspergillus alliaceus]|uniref:Uncharacterized protein n=1 Tax=Petromyces alliaceus TaxID=209559 RepID=A0A8H5ZYC6_PETAA|nr:hypothetical protein ETB97_003167 [Aspergillus burnettii]
MNISSFFDNGDQFLYEFKDLFDEIGVMGRHGFPKFLLYIYKGTNDDIAPTIEDTTALVRKFCEEGTNGGWMTDIFNRIELLGCNWNDLDLAADVGKEDILEYSFPDQEIFQSPHFGKLNPGIVFMAWKLTLHTTTVSFQLPNYANGQDPRPSIQESPYGMGKRNFTPRHLDSDTAWTTLNATLNVIYPGIEGPLLYIALALFGSGSIADMNTPFWQHMPTLASSTMVVLTLSLLYHFLTTRTPSRRPWVTRVSNKVPLFATQDVGRILILDETPGWMGERIRGKIGERHVEICTRPIMLAHAILKNASSISSSLRLATSFASREMAFWHATSDPGSYTKLRLHICYQ